jgi:hypothetical protein
MVGFMIATLIKCLILKFLQSQNIYLALMKGVKDRNIIISQHCYGCTAGAGSSCQGVVA